MMVLTNIWITIQEHCLKIVHHYRIQVIVVGSFDIELLYCIKNINLCIRWSLICLKEESTSEMIKFSLDLKTIGPDCLVTKLLILTSTEVIAKVALYCHILLQNSLEE